MTPRPRLPAATLAATLFAAGGLLAACSPSYSPDAYDSTAVQQASKVAQGVIAGVRPVVVVASGTVGGLTGAAAGGIAGSQAPVGGVGTALTALGGTVVGGLVGAGIERAAGDTTAYEYVVREPKGELVSVTQQDAVPLRIGQKVLVIAGKQARIVPDYTVPPPALPPTPALPPKPPPNNAPPGPITSEPLPPPATFTPVE